MLHIVLLAILSYYYQLLDSIQYVYIYLFYNNKNKIKNSNSQSFQVWINKNNKLEYDYTGICDIDHERYLNEPPLRYTYILSKKQSVLINHSKIEISPFSFSFCKQRFLYLEYAYDKKTYEIKIKNEHLCTGNEILSSIYIMHYLSIYHPLSTFNNQYLLHGIDVHFNHFTLNQHSYIRLEEEKEKEEKEKEKGYTIQQLIH